MFRQTAIKTCAIAAMLLVLGAYTLFGGHFARELVIEAAILAMLAISVDVLAGYGGMISLAHGAILGLGAYGYAVTSLKLGAPPAAAMLAAAFAFFCLGCLVLAYGAAAWVLTSGFGRSLCGIRENEDRMRALGVAVWKFKSGAFAFSGLLAGLAGALAAQHSMFVSPEMMTWTVSGEALVTVILGGLGTLAGPVVGAVLLVFLKHLVSGMTAYWHMIIGAVLILAVVAGGRGVYGGLERLIGMRLPRRAQNREPARNLMEAQADA
jgi:ABC-type branched-subunit amino acid transport system permease subunit